MKILALCGSLRAASINAALLRTAARVAPPGMEVAWCVAVGELPLFNPDLEAQPPPAALRLQADVAWADALLIASPEYAHGVTGVIKNALDWLVSQEAFVNKPVAVFNASPRAHHADDALRETLRTMSARIVEPACLSLPLLGAHLAENEMATHPLVAPALIEALQALQRAVEPEQAWLL
ncbi:NADPH-dependent FMN reductase [Acidovorax radicis]|uniref:NADPH-dependent FMN reductase n=1 Tax=Acidovorax radicis TaxID=758826 RepID=UPI0005525272|nr:NADPH-dependent FMN reductase [Acidovorax radicis]